MSRRLSPTLACLATSTVLVWSTAVPAAAAASTVDYVALGDSYSAGVGAPGQGFCLRTSRSYTAQWAARNDPASYRSLACGGAKTGDVVSLQVPFVPRATDLVTITIGGNDAGFADTVVSCTLGSEAACAAEVASARQYIATTLPAALDRTYRAIRQKAPDADVVVLGYPRLFDTSRATCGIGGMSVTKRRAINQGADDLAAVIAARARAAGFTYSDVRDEFDGHGACAPDPWINGLVLLPPTDSFHPNTNGYTRGYLPALESALS